MKLKPLVAALAIVGVGVASYWYYSPYLTIHAMREAAQTKDADAFNERVDYPKVRESLKGQMSAMMAEKVGQTDNAFAAFGTMLGMAVAHQAVEAFVRPEMVMRSMHSGSFKPVPTMGQESASEGSGSDKKKVQWTLEHSGVNKVIAYAQKPDQPELKKDFGLVFERSSFSDWRLTEIRLSTLKQE